MIERQGWQRTRSTDPVTSHEAADSVTDKLRETQEAVLGLFVLFGAMTDEELVDAYGDAIITPRQSPSGLRTRRHELVDAGHLEDTGERKRLVSGRRAIVWGVPLTEGEGPDRGIKRMTPQEILPQAASFEAHLSPSVSGSSLFAADSGDSMTPESDPLIDPGQMTIEEALDDA